jgi:dipeptidyl aminopeptidase/acylaminoacyl peptidase
VYSLDTLYGKVERWTESETGGLNPETFAEPKLVHWTTFDGRQLSGFLYLPDEKKFPGKRPVIVDIHGGPEGQFRPVFLGRDNYLLNELGVAILFPNVRGSSGYGKTFLTLDNATKREDSYNDLGTLLDWVKQQPRLDGGRIMVTGGSYGGHMTFAAAVRFGDKLRCAMPEVGMSNLVSFLERTEAYRRDLRRAEYGDERDPKVRAFLEKIAPLNNAKQIHVPLFVVQGANDPRVPASEAEQMVSTVRGNGQPVWYLLAKDDGHGFAKKKNRDFLLYAEVMFVRRHLLGDGATGAGGK